MATAAESKTTKTTAKRTTSTTSFPSREAIEFRAYELFLNRDGFSGSELEDWLIAEQELFASKPVRKSKAA